MRWPWRGRHSCSCIITFSEQNQENPMPYTLSRLRDNLRPFRLYYFPRLRSTNDHAAALRQSGRLYAPAVVLTSRQTAGRGRGGNTWFSNAGVMTVTFAMPVEAHLAPHQLPLIAGLAVRRTAAELCGDDGIALKWPNDVLYNGRKLAGLLCERIHKIDLIGVGMNVNLEPAEVPPPLNRRITSLRAIGQRSCMDMNDVLISLTHHLKEMLERRHEHSFGGFLHEYDAHHALRGREITVLNEGELPLRGRCEGLDSTGRMLVRQGGTLHHIISGQIGMQ
jgi:BirA family biotin operon repressor/biotin-[acetyl-CoA-carboxylase] ligase